MMLHDSLQTHTKNRKRKKNSYTKQDNQQIKMNLQHKILNKDMQHKELQSPK
ncbi:hypothetical protein pb186bvf_011920 [Paramecium bursaria]